MTSAAGAAHTQDHFHEPLIRVAYRTAIQASTEIVPFSR